MSYPFEQYTLLMLYFAFICDSVYSWKNKPEEWNWLMCRSILGSCITSLLLRQDRLWQVQVQLQVRLGCHPIRLLHIKIQVQQQRRQLNSKKNVLCSLVYNTSFLFLNVVVWWCRKCTQNMPIKFDVEIAWILMVGND